MAITSGWGHETVGALNGVDALKVMERFTPSVIVTDLKMPRMAALNCSAVSANWNPSAHHRPYRFRQPRSGAVNGARPGRFWFLEKPISADALQLLIERAGAHSTWSGKPIAAPRLDLSRRARRTGCTSKSMRKSSIRSPSGPHGRAGSSDRRKRNRQRTGRSGDPRRRLPQDGPFVAVNCPHCRNLVESEILGTKRARSPGRSTAASGAWSWPRRVRSSWTNWLRCRCRCRPSCCACFRTCTTAVSAGRRRSGPTCALSPPPTAREGSARAGKLREICTTAWPCSTSFCRPCASARKTSLRWWNR